MYSVTLKPFGHFFGICIFSIGLKKSFFCCHAGLTSLDISADSTVAITGSEDATAKISNIHTGKVLGTFAGRPSQMTEFFVFKISMSVKSAMVCIVMCTTMWRLLRDMNKSQNFVLPDCDPQAAMQSNAGSRHDVLKF